ncbi:TonB-dependent receptor plug domain-containing protein [Hansschlegelia plantiphila]|uniref:TonB-dependent receptor plug domain-containing protein n=1 Tax=Hansschlegelia plantiphila TaxID=374655 RepID=A0A9W6J488_9HYPH|nr:TonB-dependent receptor plug domain-containing protein [Hansschlegelia plantiphila]GLK69079.1 hypothetical protein GCM10008179_27170 [Hansschlegelia plantiphila]
MRINVMAGSAVGALLSATGAASAQDAHSGTTELDQINVNATKAPTAQNTTTIGEQDVQRHGSNKIDDVLRSVPGVFTRQSGQQPGVAVNIRGFEGSGRVNMMRTERSSPAVARRTC